MRISIVTPVLNGMPWLPEAVISVANQRATDDVQHIVLDAGSTDGSRGWLEDHRELGYSTVFEPDEGQTDALAKGFERATGAVFGWLNSDDLLEPAALDRVVQAFTREPDAVLVSGRCLQIDGEGVPIGAIETPPQSGLKGLLNHPTNLAQPATFFKADAYRAVGGLNRKYNLAMDVDLWFRLARTGRVVLLPDATLARFRLHPAAKSVANVEGAVREDFSIRVRNGMSLRSPAARALLRYGYLRPAARQLKRLLRWGSHSTGDKGTRP